MIIQCAVCQLILGEKEPLDNKGVTHTYCPVCYGEAMIDLEYKTETIPEFRCFFCENKATSVAYFSKDYNSLNKTIENPTLTCDICFDSPRIMNQISPIRNGKNLIYRFLFSTIGNWTKNQLTYHVGKKNWEINHLSSRYWRKMIWRIHYLNIPPKE